MVKREFHIKPLHSCAVPSKGTRSARWWLYSVKLHKLHIFKKYMFLWTFVFTLYEEKKRQLYRVQKVKACTWVCISKFVLDIFYHVSNNRMRNVVSLKLEFDASVSSIQAHRRSKSRVDRFWRSRKNPNGIRVMLRAVSAYLRWTRNYEAFKADQLDCWHFV